MPTACTTARLICGLFCCLIGFSSCLKDKCTHRYTITTPVLSKLSALRSAVKSQPAKAIGATGKMYIFGKWILLNEPYKGIHVIDNTHPGHPQKVSFINIPGNIDLYTKGNVLYADMYCDFLALDLTVPTDVRVEKFLTKAFAEKAVYTSSNNPDSIQVITGWNTRDTTVSCSSAPNPNVYYDMASASNFAASSSNSPGTAAGSMARFAAVGDYMYTVSMSNLNVLDIHTAADPLFVSSKNIGWNIETIFPFNNRLFIGAGNSMSIYGLEEPANPQGLSWNGHWCSNDPVVADNNYAYVTLHEANICSATVNQLEIYDLNATGNARLIKSYPLTHPQGLSKDGNLLFICDGQDGLKIYDVADIANIKLLQQLPASDTYDVIANNGIAYLVAKDGLYQYDYSDLRNIHLISRMAK